MNNDCFVHLHLHSEYSLLDGACRVSEIADYAKQLGQKAVAVTDHGVMFAAIDFYNDCISKDIKPIIGCEVYVARESRHDMNGIIDARPYHLVLLCKNNKGYENLIRLVSLGYTEGFYNKPRIDRELISRYHEGLVCLSGCFSGELARKLIDGSYDEAKETALWYKSIFGDDYYIEIQNHETPEDMRLIPLLYRLSDETGIETAATNDVHYIRKQDSSVQRVLTAIQTNTVLSEASSFGMPNDSFYMRSTPEMLELFKGHEKSVYNTSVIADKCNISFEFGKLRLPRYDMSAKASEKFSDNEEYFISLCKAGLYKRYGHEVPTEYAERLEYEISVIRKMGYVDYFLIVWDFVAYAKRNLIPVGPGRGSGAGSLAAYCIGITDIDPMKYNLLFERFLNPERVSMPDFDIDFCYEGRGRVIEYVINKYGTERVSQIVTFGTMAARAAVRDVARVLGISYQKGDSVARLIPQGLHTTLRSSLDESAELRSLYSSDREIHIMIDTAMRIEGMPRNISTHAAGVVISDRPVMEYVPVISRDDVVSTQYTMTALERLGLLKMDFLGLRNLTIIRDAQNNIRENEPDFDIRNIPTDDRATFEMISAGDTSGVFQFESAGMRNMLRSLRPDCIEDLIAALSLYRPGPMESIPKYIDTRRHPERIRYKHPLLENILKVTHGCIVYQEQVMEICRVLAGYSYGRADLVRRAMAKKKADVMEKERGVFVEGCLKNGVDRASAESIFDEMSGFASYAFNKSHAAAYSYVAYQTAYLRCHYFKEYMAALMTTNENGKLSEYISECKKRGIRILPPDINESMMGFTATDDGIRFSLLSAKNVGSVLIEKLIAERQENGKFTSPIDFCTRMCGIDLNKRAFESLVKCGAFDNFGYTRRTLLTNSDTIIDSVMADMRNNITGQLNIFGESISETIDIKHIPEYDDDKMRLMEKETLGMYVTSHPLDKYTLITKCMRLTTVAASEGMPDKAPIRMLLVITDVREHLTKKQVKMAFVKAEDMTGECEIIIFPMLYMTADKTVKNGSVILVDGHISYEDDKRKIIADAVVEEKMIGKILSAEQNTLYIRCESTDREKTESITKLCIENVGKSKVIFSFTDIGRNTASKRISGVSITPAFLEKLEEIVGVEGMFVKVGNNG